MIVITAGLYGVPALFKIKNAFTDIIYSLHHYLYYSPAYIHTLLIFAFCNVDDLSWGTKGSDSKHEIKLDDRKNSRT
jgi:cellulose synthase/poly-beta-1,6-N-acetylglucosamine synthase-like glycosyltransferase